MNNMIKTLGVVAVALVLGQSIQATTINGNVGFTGRVTYDTGSAGTATEVTSWIDPAVNGTFGAFTTLAYGTAVSFNPAYWHFATVAPINNFWSVGGFTFELLSSSITAQGTGFVVVNGTGIVTGNGYTATSMTWSFTSQDPPTTANPDSWTFSVSANSVPDGGATVMLLGLALSGVALLRKKLTA
jgi:hypothetical protein